MPAIIRIAAALIVNSEGRTLVVRKNGTQAFMQAGGKIEPNETAIIALQRELEEELGLILDASSAEYLGCFSAPAANEAGHIVEAELFRLSITKTVTPAAEIAEIAWIDPLHKTLLPLAPLTRDYVLPLAAATKSD